MIVSIERFLTVDHHECFVFECVWGYHLLPYRIVDSILDSSGNSPLKYVNVVVVVVVSSSSSSLELYSLFLSIALIITVIEPLLRSSLKLHLPSEKWLAFLVWSLQILLFIATIITLLIVGTIICRISTQGCRYCLLFCR